MKKSFFFKCIAAVLLLVLVAIFTTAIPLGRAKQSDSKLAETRTQLKLRYQERNEVLTQNPTLPQFPASHLEESLNRIDGLNQADWILYDQTEQELLNTLAQIKDKSFEPTKKKLIDHEKKIIQARRDYTEAAWDRNETWRAVPEWARKAMGVVPAPHFKTDLSLLRKEKGLDP